jgi:hypothetical protein
MGVRNLKIKPAFQPPLMVDSVRDTLPGWGDASAVGYVTNLPGEALRPIK